jgi:hypothetical protein
MKNGLPDGKLDLDGFSVKAIRSRSFLSRGRRSLNVVDVGGADPTVSNSTSSSVLRSTKSPNFLTVRRRHKLIAHNNSPNANKTTPIGTNAIAKILYIIRPDETALNAVRK